MWAAFKALGLGAKIGMLLTILAAFAAVAAIGYNKGLNVSAVKIAQYEKKVESLGRQLAEKQTVTDVKYVTQFKDRVAYVDRVVYRNRDVVRDNVVSHFKFTKGWIYAYNQSVKGELVDPVLARDDTVASVSEVEALAGTIIPNNGIALSNAAKLEALQQWIRETRENAERVNENTK